MGSFAKLRSRLARESLVVIGGQVTAAMTTLAAIRLITEVLSSDSYGRIVLTLAVLSLMQSLLVSPLLAAQLRFHPEVRAGGRESDLRRAIASNLIWGGTPVLVVASFLTCLLAISLGDGTLFIVMVVGSIWLAATGLCGYFKNILNAKRQQFGLAVTAVAEAALKPGVAVLVVIWLGVSTAAFVGGQALGVLIATLVAAVWTLCQGEQATYASRTIGVSSYAPGSHRLLAKEIRRYAVPLVPLALVNWILHLSDRYLLMWFHGPSDVGVYAAAYGLLSQPFLLLGSIATLIFRPYLFEAASRGERDLMMRHCLRWLAFTAVLGVPAWGAVFVMAQPLADLFLAEEYRVSASIFAIIAAAYLFLAVGFVFENWILALKKTRALLSRAVASMVVSLILAVVLIPRYSLVGASWATVGGFATHTVMCFLVFKSSRRLTLG